jgi:CBS domain containing-hemolysin-like protein
LAAIVLKILVPTIWIMFPLVKLAEWITKILTSGKRKTLIQRDEFLALTELGIREGVLDIDESRVLKNLFRFHEIRVQDIMTPRAVIFALDERLSIEEVLSAYDSLQFTRIPLYDKELDEITGYILKSDVLTLAIQNKKKKIVTEIKRPIPVIQESQLLNEIFEQMLIEGSHIAVVYDTYGSLVGLITMEDIIETLLGMEIVDESDRVEDMRALARKDWEKRAKSMGLIDVPSVEPSENGGGKQR